MFNEQTLKRDWMIEAKKMKFVLPSNHAGVVKQNVHDGRDYLNAIAASVYKE